jgi:outer membrane protein assembly factor BamB
MNRPFFHPIRLSIQAGILILMLAVGAHAEPTGSSVTNDAGRGHPAFKAGALDTNAPSADWPMYRGGPSLAGVAAGSLPEKPDLMWTFKGGDAIHSSAAIVGGRVYVGCSDSNVYALNLADGKKLWSYQTAGEVESSPLILNGRVYVGSADAFLYALEADSGKFLWKYETGDRIPGAPNWVKSSKGGAPWILVGSYDFKLHCVDSASGKGVWSYASANYINGAPAVAEGLAVFGGCDAMLHVVSLADGQQVRQVEAGGYIAGSAALEGSRAYLGQYENMFLSIDVQKGSTNWIYKDKPFPFFSSPAVASDRIVVGSRDKRVHCLKRDTGEKLWVFPTRGKVDASPVICGDKVVVGSDDGRVYMLALSDGHELWSYEIGQPVSASPAVAGGWVVVGAEDGVLYAFGRKKAAP